MSPAKAKKKPKTAFGNFFSKLKKDFKKGFTEMQLSVQVGRARTPSDQNIMLLKFQLFRKTDTVEPPMPCP